MNYSPVLILCGLSLLLIVSGNPTDPCSNPSDPNFNSVIPLRRTTATSQSLLLPSFTSVQSVDGCFVLDMTAHSLYAYQEVQSNSFPQEMVQFHAYMYYTCEAVNISYILYGTQYYAYQNLMTVSDKADLVSLTGLFLNNGIAYYGSEMVGFSLTTTPVSFVSNTRPVSKSTTRSITRNPGSQCRITNQNNYLTNTVYSTASFTISVTLDEGGPINFVIPSDLAATAGITETVTTYHHCTCSVL